MAAIVGVIVGVPVLRLQGDYLAIVTLAFGEIIKGIVNNLYVGLDATQTAQYHKHQNQNRSIKIKLAGYHS